MNREAVIRKLKEDVLLDESVQVKVIVIQDTLWPGIREYRVTCGDHSTYGCLDSNGVFSPFIKVPAQEK